MASTSLTDLTPDTRERVEALIKAAAALGLDVMVASTLRSCADQGTSTATVDVQGMKLKRAPGCRSWHTWGRAADLVLKVPSPERYAKLGELGKTFGLEWGGDFKTNFDPIHFQYHPGMDAQKLCPDPNDCAGALARAGLPLPQPPPPPVPGAADESDAEPAGSTPSIAVFVAGAAIGWFGLRFFRRKRF